MKSLVGYCLQSWKTGAWNLGMLLEVGMVHCCNVGSAVEGVEQGQSLVAARGMSQDTATAQIRDRGQDC